MKFEIGQLVKAKYHRARLDPSRAPIIHEALGPNQPRGQVRAGSVGIIVGLKPIYQAYLVRWLSSSASGKWCHREIEVEEVMEPIREAQSG